MPPAYEIRVHGRMSDAVAESFEDFTKAVQPTETVMRGQVVDQAALHGVLDRIQSLGLELIEIRQIPRGEQH